MLENVLVWEGQSGSIMLTAAHATTLAEHKNVKGKALLIKTENMDAIAGAFGVHASLKEALQALYAIAGKELVIAESNDGIWERTAIEIGQTMP